MPSPYKSQPFPLSNLNDSRRLVRVSCAFCRRAHDYFPSDLIQIFGDVDVDSLIGRMKCEGGDHGAMRVEAIYPSGKEAVGIKIRRLVSIHIRRGPEWREE